MFDHTYMAKEKKSVPGFKVTKDHLKLLFGGNTVEIAN
jgi:hypothetical protein